MNINDKDTLHGCTSCQACAAVCPKGAISISLNEEGFYRPIIDTNKCVECGICKSVCYKYYDIPSYSDVDNLVNYAASADSEEVVANTTSGGLGDILCEQLINDGYLCVGVDYDLEKNIAITKIASSRNETYGFRGSKYIQSYTFDAFKEVLKSHLDDKVAVFGTPCHIFAINKYLKKRNKRDNFILIDIYCHGCPSMLIWEKYLSNIQKETNEKNFDSISFRSKAYGWGNYYVAQMKKNGRVLFTSPKIKDKFYTLFFSDALLNEACYDCQLRSTMDSTDIRIGDFWGKKYISNSRGVSLVTINPLSRNGLELFEKVKTKVSCTLHQSDECIPYQSWGHCYYIDENLRRKLLSSLIDPAISINETVNIYRSSLPFSAKLKQLVKDIILILPRPFVIFFKVFFKK